MECGKEILKLWTHNGHNLFRILAEDEGGKGEDEGAETENPGRGRDKTSGVTE